MFCSTMFFLEIQVGSCLLPIARTFLKMGSNKHYLLLQNVMAKDPTRLLIQGTMG